MSSINIKRAIENIRSGTTVYTPPVELIVNAIQAVRATRPTGGLVTVTVLRSSQSSLLEEDRIPPVDGFCVEDDGVGFDQRNRDSFDELYTELKAADGGKGFGRFTCLKYFRDLSVESRFREGDALARRTFRMGLQSDIIVDEVVEPAEGDTTGSKVTIVGIKSVKFPDKGLDAIARVLVEKLLPYFIDRSFECPRVVVQDDKGSSPIVLNEYLIAERRQIVELNVASPDVIVGSEPETFHVRVFKFYAPRNAKSKISLVAHRREVTETPIQAYIPEFAEEFFEPAGEDGARDRNFTIKAYVFGGYLDRNVSLERGEFGFGREPDLVYGIAQRQIEKAAADVAERAIGAEIAARRQRKQDRIRDYVETDAPWHRLLSKEADFSALPMRPSPEEIELHLQRAKFEVEGRTRAAVRHLLEDASPDELREKVAELAETISQTGKNDLAHYVSLRRCVLALLERALEKDEHGKYRSEGSVHDIIVPRRRDSEDLNYEDHNLWILDERLNFTSYLTSDKPLGGGASARVDLAGYNRKVAFRGDNEPSNAITIFEFKKPGRDDFANPSSKEDPVEQIVRYVNDIRRGKCSMPNGRQIRVSPQTPFYGYIVCDLSAKVKDWLYQDKNFTEMPDGLGWFDTRSNINLHIEVLSWDKILKDATMRNKIFFTTLGI